MKDNVRAIAPIVALVLILAFTIVPLGSAIIAKFLIGAVLIVIGLSFFLVGVDLAIIPLGDHTGHVIAESGKFLFLMAGGLILGFFISLAEPGMLVLAGQVEQVTMGQLTSRSLMIFVSLGFAFVLSIGLRRIFSKVPLHILLLILYGIIWTAAIFVSPEFLALAFDSSGATTGILAVPFILALGVGVASRKRDSVSSEEDSFGLVAMASAGAVMGVMLLNLVSGTSHYDTSIAIDTDVTTSVLLSFVGIIGKTVRECFFILLPLMAIFILLQITVLKLQRKHFRRMIVGFVYSYVGLLLFFVGVNGGFMDVGMMLGLKLAETGNYVILIITGFIIGLITIIAEPAVYVQTRQIEDVTAGHIKRKTVLVPFCLGVGIAVMLAVIRILNPAIHLWYILLPGFAIALTLSFFVPRVFVGIGFDAGGVATGPMTATFILAFTQGIAASKPDANLLADGFGMISLVCMFPILTIQILGLMYKFKLKKKTDI